MPKRSKLSERAVREGRPVREIIAEMYLIYGKQKLVAQKLEIAPSTLCQTIQRLGGRERTIVIFPEEKEQTS